MLRKLYNKIRLFALKRKEPYLSLYKTLGFIPDSIEPYREAVSHCSAGIKTKYGRPLNNERLEFLGDTVLGMAVSDIIYRRFPGRREGFLSNVRSRIVRRKSLDAIARKMNIAQLLRTSGNVKNSSNHVGGNALEALIGAIYIDKGYETAVKFVSHKIIAPYIDLEKIAASEYNFKSRLMEWGQKNGTQIEYRLKETHTDSRNRSSFTFELLVEGVMSAVGTGFSKKDAQQAAAGKVYKKIITQESFVNSIFAIRDERLQRENCKSGVPDGTETAAAVTD